MKKIVIFKKAVLLLLSATLCSPVLYAQKAGKIDVINDTSKPPAPPAPPKAPAKPVVKPPAKPNPTFGDKEKGSNFDVTAGGHTFTMVWVQGGTFTMGCTNEQGADCDSDEKPAHEVKQKGFYIGKLEVTQGLWKAVMGENPSNFKGDNLPVEKISWEMVQDFLATLNRLTGKSFRLPTEAEWEYAARGGRKSSGTKYSGGHSSGSCGWYDENSGNITHPAGGKNPNELGLYDMSGNVSEWCSDWWGRYGSASQTNPTGADSGVARVFRGGSWSYNAAGLRTTDRDGVAPAGRSGDLGFRLACSLD